MTFTATTADGRQFMLCRPLSCCINREEGVPADDMTAVFLYEAQIPQLSHITVKQDNETVFTGIVDEQSFLLSENGGLVTVYARSMAALLLDNESLPQVYNAPDAQTIFTRHIQPLGITRYTCEKKEAYAGFTVAKGFTHWQVLENFCKLCLGTFPAVDGQGTVHMCGYPDQKAPLVFTNDKAGIRFTAVQSTVKRCKRLSQVHVKTSAQDNYSMPVINHDATTKGILRVRYLNASDLSQLPVSHADKMLQAGDYAAFSVTLTCPGALVSCMGRSAVLCCGGKREAGLYVGRLQYTYTQNDEKTVLTLLRRREE